MTTEAYSIKTSHTGDKRFEVEENDVLVATVWQPGAPAMNIEITGETSLEAVIQRIKKLIDTVRGVHTLSLRNITRGWSLCRSIVKRGAMSIRSAANAVLNVWDPEQSAYRAESKQLEFSFA